MPKSKKPTKIVVKPLHRPYLKQVQSFASCLAQRQAAPPPGDDVVDFAKGELHGICKEFGIEAAEAAAKAALISITSRLTKDVNEMLEGLRESAKSEGGGQR